MADETTTTTFTAALSDIVRARMLPFAARTAVVAPLYALDDPNEGLVGRIARMDDNSAGITDPVAEASEVANVAVTPTSVTLTPDVTGIMYDVSDLVGSSTPLAGMQTFVEDGTGILTIQLEDDFHALYASFSTSVGVTGSPLTTAVFLSGAVILKMNLAPFPIFSVLAPVQVSNLAIDLGGLPGISQGTSVGLLDVTGANIGLKGVVGSIPVYESPRAVSINADADREGWIGNRDAITIRRKWNLRPEFQRNASLVSTEIVVTSAYGLAETADDWGVEIVSIHE